MKNNIAILFCVFFLAVFASSCNKKNIKKPDIKTSQESAITLPSIEIEGSTETISMMEPDIRGGEFLEDQNIAVIHFGFNKYALTSQIRDILTKNAKIMKIHKEATFLVEGHCDDRGTIEYNLALGQKRAKEVKDYYVRLGVPESQLGTISYGEEKPLCREETEECWAKNRRAETKMRK